MSDEQKKLEELGKKLSDEELLDEVLGWERAYVKKRAAELGYKIKPQIYPRQTRTCREKADLLTEMFGVHWQVENTVKALYFAFNKNSEPDVNGFVMPESEGKRRLDPDVVFDVIKETTGDPPTYDSVRSALNGHGDFGRYIPPDMETGTCTPFPAESVMRNIISTIYIHDISLSGKNIGDISIGGHGYVGQTRGLHVVYDSIFAILYREFGPKKVKLVNLFPKSL